MKNDLDIHQVLSVYSTIIDNGEKSENGTMLFGMTALSSFDGYVVELTDGTVNLTVHFHNKYQLDYPNQIALQSFLEKIERLDKLKQQRPT